MKAAIDKLNKEIKRNKNPYVQVIGQFLIEQVSSNPRYAENVLAEDKTILGSLDEMRKEAEKIKVGDCAVLTDQQGFAIVLHYFGMKEEIPNSTEKVLSKPKGKRKQKGQKVVPLNGEFVQTSLYDFIGEG